MVRRSPTGGSDENLATDIQKGYLVDECAFELHRRWDSALFAFFRNRHFPLEDCLDLSQEVWARVFKSMGQFQGKYFRAWLFRIARNTSNNAIRDGRTGKRYAETVDIDATDRPARTIEVVDPQPPPSARVLGREMVEALRRSVAGLPPRMRQCLLLRVQGLRVPKIAFLMKLSDGAVKAHLHQARKRLKTELGDLFGEAGF